jgi:hypothetical protein
MIDLTGLDAAPHEIAALDQVLAEVRDRTDPPDDDGPWHDRTANGDDHGHQ